MSIGLTVAWYGHRIGHGEISAVPAVEQVCGAVEKLCGSTHLHNIAVIHYNYTVTEGIASV